MGNKSSEKAVECFCNHLSTFASGFLVAPNTIDFAELEVDPTKNPVIFITLSVITGYMLVQQLFKSAKISSRNLLLALI